jgi:alpha-galactosidase
MITVFERFFHLETEDTSYVFSHESNGLLLHHYYGKRAKFADFSHAIGKNQGGLGLAIAYEGQKDQLIDSFDLEFSTFGIGDFREPQLLPRNKQNGYYANFKYQGHAILENDEHPLPHSHDADAVLRVDLFDEVLNVTLELYYKVFEKANVISRYVRLINHSKEDFGLARLFSAQVDFFDDGYTAMTFDGTWVKERHLTEQKLTGGIFVNDSKCGASSAKHNPLVILRGDNTTEDQGAAYGFNLVYSGNHKTTIETTPLHKTRVLLGISDFAFDYTIAPGKDFVTPEAVLSYSGEGLNKLSQNFHDFVNGHIIPKQFQNRIRPLLFNSWESTYFHYNEKKLLDLAQKAKAIGLEMFVLDDGWFGKRDNDQSSLGDWDVNLKKLPHGLKGLAEAINKIGLDFGLWVEPEMVSIDSDLYRAHPDWAITLPGRKPGVGRAQLVLDLTNPEVRTFLINKMTEVFQSCHLKYVKWDYNRSLTDMHGKTLDDQGEFFHRYIQGLYEVLDALTSKFPDLFMEGCSSGGNRFDLGMLCFFPQIWTSDCTDYLERLYIQTGTSYGYPPSTMSNHVSAVPNHQTLRITPLSSRFNMACFGSLGYELDLGELDQEGIKTLKNQVRVYKRYRELFQFGRFYRSEPTAFKNNRAYFYVLSEDKKQGMLGFFQSLVHPAMSEDVIRVRGLNDELYSIANFPERLDLKRFGGVINLVSPIRLKIGGKFYNFICKVYRPSGEKESYLVYGPAFSDVGVRLNSQFMGTGFTFDVRVLGDFGSRMYEIKPYQSKYVLKKKNPKIKD